MNGFSRVYDDDPLSLASLMANEINDERDRKGLGKCKFR